MKQIKHKRTKLKVLGYYQTIGGIGGIGITIYLIAQTAILNRLLLLLFLIALGLYSFSIYCGTQVLKNKSNALTISLVNQYLQLINIAVLGYGFKYVSGLLLSVGVDLTNSFNLKFNMAVISTWNISWNVTSDNIELHLNLVALFFIIFIDKLKSIHSDNAILNDVEEIGLSKTVD